MNKRQVDLLKKLIIQDDYQPIKYFSNIFGASVKTISKDLDDIEEIINPIGVKIERKQGRGIKLCYALPQLDKLNEILNDISLLDSDKAVEDRRTEILLNLLINTNKYTTIQKLSDKYMVSRTSINNDLKEVQKRLNRYNLQLSKTLKGTRIIGSEINIRKALVSTIQEYAKINPGYISEYQSIRHKELNIAPIMGFISDCKYPVVFGERGRVGDSPLSGSGFYVDSRIGGATATGLGEDIMKGCISYEIVRLMKDGYSPQDAADKAVFELTNLLISRRQKAGDISVVCLNNKGEFGVATNIKEFSFVVATEKLPPTVYTCSVENNKTIYKVASEEWMNNYMKTRTAPLKLK